MKCALAIAGLVLLAVGAYPKDKPKILDARVLKARYVVIIPQSGTEPDAQAFDPRYGPGPQLTRLTPDEQAAYHALEEALRRWGRLQIVDSWQNADLTLFMTRTPPFRRKDKSAPVQYQDELQVYIYSFKSDFPVWRETLTNGFNGPDPQLVRDFRAAFEQAEKEAAAQQKKH